MLIVDIIEPQKKMHFGPAEQKIRDGCISALTKNHKEDAVSVDRTRDLQIFSLTLSQLSYPRFVLW